LARGDGIAVWVEERIAQQASDTLVLTLGELMLLGVGDAGPVLGGGARGAFSQPRGYKISLAASPE